MTLRFVLMSGHRQHAKINGDHQKLVFHICNASCQTYTWLARRMQMREYIQTVSTTCIACNDSEEAVQAAAKDNTMVERTGWRLSPRLMWKPVASSPSEASSSSEREVSLCAGICRLSRQRRRILRGWTKRLSICRCRSLRRATSSGWPLPNATAHLRHQPDPLQPVSSLFMAFVSKHMEQ